ncbi:MAG TPA: glycosyltransferase family 2 protein [Mucilaginibacter sp.]|jgi:glycosyltransferase involved in cell wall biosynthesis
MKNIGGAMDNPLVSIIIPVYNSEKYVAECIESAINQTWSNKEIIIVDDGSTDRSLTIVQRQANNPLVKIIQQSNKGASAARNTGLKEAKGDYIQFLDADDLLSPNKIEEQIKGLNGSITHLGLCHTLHFNENEDYNKRSVPEEWFDTDSDDPVDFLIKLHAGVDVMPEYGGMVQPNAWLTPRHLIEKAGMWNEFRCPDDDGEFFCRVVLASDGIRFSKNGINYYRKYTTGGSLSGQKSSQAFENILLSIDLKYGYLKAKTNDAIVDRVFARHYWSTGVMAYPHFKTLSKHCIKKGAELGYAGPKYAGGPAGHIITRFFGWKTARYFSLFQQALKSIKLRSR